LQQQRDAFEGWALVHLVRLSQGLAERLRRRRARSGPRPDRQDIALICPQDAIVGWHDALALHAFSSVSEAMPAGGRGAPAFAMNEASGPRVISSESMNILFASSE